MCQFVLCIRGKITVIAHCLLMQPFIHTHRALAFRWSMLPVSHDKYDLGATLSPALDGADSYLHISRHLVWSLSRHGNVCYWRVNPLVFLRHFHNLQSHVGGLRSFTHDRKRILSPYVSQPVWKKTRDHTLSLQCRLFPKQNNIFPMGWDTATQVTNIDMYIS